MKTAELYFLVVLFVSLFKEVLAFESVDEILKFFKLKIPGQVVQSRVNPLSPKSDKHQISPCNINALENRVVMRITDMITQDEFA